MYGKSSIMLWKTKQHNNLEMVNSTRLNVGKNQNEKSSTMIQKTTQIFISQINLTHKSRTQPKEKELHFTEESNIILRRKKIDIAIQNECIILCLIVRHEHAKKTK